LKTKNKMIQILSKNGKKLYSLKEWQALYGVEENKVGRFFSTNEKEFKDGIASELLICFLDDVRELSQEPMIINSLWRSEVEQTNLKVAKAKYSPHPKGMAGDIQCRSLAHVNIMVSYIRIVAKKLGIKVRLGYKSYLAKDQFFIHVDVCPNYYAKCMPFNELTHPKEWETELTW